MTSSRKKPKAERQRTNARKPKRRSLHTPFTEAQLRVAHKDFAALGPAERMRLARETAETRFPELQQAFPTLRLAFSGHRARLSAKGRLRVLRDVCIVFVVPRKRKPKRGSRLKLLPRELLAYHRRSDGISVLCAIPADVDEIRAYNRARIQSPPQLDVVPSRQTGFEHASYACCIRRAPLPGSAFLVGCRHGFSLTQQFHPQQPNCVLRANGQAVANTLRASGPLVDEPDISFDAQLAEAVDAAALAALLDDVQLAGHAANPGDLTNNQRGFVQNARGPVPVTFRTVLTSFPIDYGVAGLAHVRHAELIQFGFAGDARTQAGDSGAAVTSERGGGMLLGMHIAANVGGNAANERTYAIPAWRLLDPGQYRGINPQEQWIVVENAGPAASPASVANAVVSAAGPGIPPELAVDHSFHDGVVWRLAADGIHIGGQAPELDPHNPQALNAFLANFQPACEDAARQFSVPIELIAATAMTESSGNPNAIRQEPGYQNDDSTPAKISAGLMQTLIATARDALRDKTIDRNFLLVPGNSLKAGAATIASRAKMTGFDPPKVACAYNAGSLLLDPSPGNRWRMRQFPIGTSQHADRFVKWFNACMGAPRAWGPGVPSFN